MTRPREIETFGRGRIATDRFVAVGERGLEFAHDGAGPTPAIPDTDQFRHQFDCRVEILHGAFKHCFLEVGLAAVGQGPGIGRIKPDRFVEVGDGEVVFALFLVGDSAVVQGLGIFGIGFERLVVILDGVFKVAFFGEGVAAVVVGDGENSRSSRRRI